ncbi:MAG TPA: DUF2970 domain-containing protein [Salinisphaeraceae bacterium]|nr:DUF2970 domain-containing protein [Salinisphaeraceae bacterium]
MATNESDMEHEQKQPERRKQHTLGRTLFSVLSALFGVQSSANRERDQKEGNPAHFFLIGSLAVTTLVALIWLFVNMLIGLYD